MPTTLQNEAAIVGIGQTKYTKNSGVSELALASEAVRNAIADAGLKPSDIDQVLLALRDPSLFEGVLDRSEPDRHQQPDDRDDHQDLHQREPLLVGRGPHRRRAARVDVRVPPVERRRGVAADERPDRRAAARASSSALSVCSQVKAAPLRPKWPWRAVS